MENIFLGKTELANSFVAIIDAGKKVENASERGDFQALAGLFLGNLSMIEVTAIALAAAGSPVNAKGEAYTALIGLKKGIVKDGRGKAGKVKGGNALYQALKKVEKVHEARDIEGVTEAVIAYLNKDSGAARGVDGLVKLVVKLATAADGGETPKADIEVSETETEAPSVPQAETLDQLAARFALAIQNATPEELLAAQSGISDAWNAIEAAHETVANMALAQAA